MREEKQEEITSGGCKDDDSFAIESMIDEEAAYDEEQAHEQRELEMQVVYRNAVFEVLRSFPNITVFNPATVLCPDGQCSINSGETILWMDDNHITESASYIQGQKIFLLLK